MLEGQTAPFEAAELRRAFDQDPEGSLAIYQDKRFDVPGIVIWAGLDPHNLPTIQKNWQRIKNESKVFACAR
jgi:hypothetical protein